MIALTPDNALELKAPLADRIRVALGQPAERVRWWWVPGRVEVFGKHTDYGGGPSLVGALPRGFLIGGVRRTDRIFHVADTGDHSSFALDTATGQTIPGEVAGWRRYVNVLARRLGRDFPGAALGADLAIASDLPRAAGMSSSSALVVGVAYAASRLAELHQRDDWRAAIATPEDLGGYFACLENGLAYKNFPGDGGVGTFGGSEDQTAIVCCRADTLSQFSYISVVHDRDAPLPADWTFVFASSGLAAEKAGRVQALYNRASLSARALVELWRTHIGASPSLTVALAGSAGAAAALHAVIDAHPLADWPASVLHQRLEHFAAEFPRVSAAADAIAAGDAAQVGALAAASHGDADRLLNNQVPETNALVALALARGAFAASAFGAGFGGSVWALVAGADDVALERFGADWRSAYAAAFPARAHLATTFAARPASGLRELKSSSGG